MGSFKVFVYGTLKPGGHYWPEFCEGKVVSKKQAKLRGELFDLHVGYPGLRLNDKGWVYGYILEFADTRQLERLDYLEGYAPERSDSQNEYNRLKVPCFDLEDIPIGEFWTYEMTDSTAARHNGTLIESGNWPV